MTRRRLPPPRSADKTEACFIARDRSALAYVCSEDDRTAHARRIAAKITRLPELVKER
jgi:hypothetical protein